MKFSGEHLIRLVRENGVNSAVEALVLEFDSPVKAGIHSYLSWKNCSDPGSHGDDISQQTWLAATADLCRFRDRLKENDYSNPSAWLRTIYINLCKKHLPFDWRERNNYSLDDKDSYEKVEKLLYPSISTNIESDYESQEAFKTVDDYINSLPDSQKRDLLLFRSGLRHSESARILGIEQACFRKRINRHFQIIRKLGGLSGE